jgi:copper homeostasis protein (lipoprotein)
VHRSKIAAFACLTATLPLAATAAPADGAPFESLPLSFIGTLPAADGPGVDWQLDLLADGSFQLEHRYRDRAPDNVFASLGRWLVGSDSKSLLLVGHPEEPISLAIESPERLRLLDRDGRPIDSALPYELDRAAVSLLEPELELRGHYRYMADAAIFDDCLTGRRLPVAFVADNIALERAYLELQQTHDLEPGAPVMAELFGRIARRPSMEGDGLVPTLEPLHFIALEPDESCPELFTAATLGNTEWQLTVLDGEPIALAPEQQRPTIVLLPEEHRLAGFGGCNRLAGGYSRHGEQLRFSRMSSTMMACPVGMELERALLHTLAATDRFRVLGRDLDLYDADGTPLARFSVTDD